MTDTPVRYRSLDEDGGRWVGFPFRDGDLVISTRSKSGTTWLQMICALLVFKTPDLPQPLADLSPWFDWLTAPRDVVLARLESQTHRRFIKTHLPLDGLPLDPRATYLVVARHPLDVAVSMYHHQANLDRARWRELVGLAPGPDAPAGLPPLHDWLVQWIEDTTPVTENLDRVPGVFHHLRDAWARRSEPNVVLLHYADLVADLEGVMRALAERIGEPVPEPAWPELVTAAGFASMRDRAADLVPDRSGVVRDPRAFFRAGRCGAYHGVLTPDELARYHDRATTLAGPDLLAWLHRG
jgi:aryl sulfotransferase